MHWAGLWAVLCAAGGGPAPAASLEPAAPPARLAPAQRRLLEQRALVVRAGGAATLRLWLRSEIPVRAAGAAPTHRDIPEGTLVGAAELPRPFTDYRGQQLPAGVYTLRFVLQPDTGDHTGTAPHREFLLLSAADRDATAGTLAPREVVELSRAVLEDRHPAVLLLWPDRGPEGTARVVHQGGGVWTAAVRAAYRTGRRRGSLPFAVTVAGSRRP